MALAARLTYWRRSRLVLAYCLQHSSTCSASILLLRRSAAVAATTASILCKNLRDRSWTSCRQSLQAWRQHFRRHGGSMGARMAAKAMRSASLSRKQLMALSVRAPELLGSARPWRWPSYKLFASSGKLHGTFWRNAPSRVLERRLGSLGDGIPTWNLAGKTGALREAFRRKDVIGGN
eukprot:scaffold1311_cov256-Pinguiococcus_pyrenoidosus.AAC.18